MTSNITYEDILRAHKECCSSNAIKSSRRIFFNYLMHSVEERGYFHVDWMYGSGSAILIKYKRKFFLLTADHVIRKATNYEFNNPSPFWVTSHSQYKVKTLYDYLMPSKIFHIGEIITEIGGFVDFNDIVLVELFYPGPLHLPNHFLNFDMESPFLKKNEFFDGQFLLAAGFAFESNGFDIFDEPQGIYTHSTLINREILPGVCRFKEGEPYMTSDIVAANDYQNLSGFSGGIVTNMQPDPSQVKMAGMILTAGEKIIRFLPSYIVQQALENYHKSRCTVIDPAINRTLSPKELLLVYKDYFNI